MKQNYINHIAFVLDGSSSMSSLKQEVIKIFDNQVKSLSTSSKLNDQETRVSVYNFNDRVECLVFDKDVLRLPSIKDDYRTSGMTALIDATVKSIEDLKNTCTLYGDHSFLLIVLTDGMNNASSHNYRHLSSLLRGLPDNWTVATLVPDSMGVSYAKQSGFEAGNIQIWDVSKNGIDEVDNQLTKITNDYMVNRSKGIRGTKSLFEIDTSKLESKTVLKELEQIDASQYDLLIVRKDGWQISEFVESYKYPYTKGSAYYQLSKREAIQASKQILVQNRISGKIYGGLKARKLLGLPDSEVKVTPSDFKNYIIYVQSTSSNRKLVKDTNVIYFK